MITWPVIIKYRGEDELTFISNEDEWKIDPDLHVHPYSDGDELIDSDGSIYLLPYNEENKIVEIKPAERKVTIKEFESLVKNHLVTLNECCVAKFQISSFHEGMKIVEKTDVQG